MRVFFGFFLFVVLLLVFLNTKRVDLEDPINIRIKSIPCEEREVLSRFFKRLFYHRDFYFTLLGLKPMGSIDYNRNLLAFPQFYKAPERHLFLMVLDEEGWRVWERYRNLFPMKKYSFIKITHGTSFGFLLINKEKANAVIEENLLLFQELIENKSCSREILRLLCDGQLSYRHSNIPCLHSYYESLGLLYGYGKANVKDFTKREQLLQSLRSLPIEIRDLPLEVVNCLEMEDTLQICSRCQPKSALEVSSLAAELKSLLDRTRLIKGTKKNNPLFPVKRSFFLGDEKSPQTQAIIEGYDKLDEAFLKTLESDNFLKTILEMLTSA